MGSAERREREKEQRRKTIIKAAKKLFYKKGLENTTMDEIADAAELSKGTLYIYFQSKEVLALSIIKETSDILNKLIRKAAHTNKCGIEGIIDITEAITDFYKKKRKEFHFLRYIDTITASLGSENQVLVEWKKGIEEQIAMVLQVVVKGIEDGSIRKDIDPEKAAFIYSNMVLSFLIRLSTNMGIILMPQSLTENEIIESMFKMIANMITNLNPEENS